MIVFVCGTSSGEGPMSAATAAPPAAKPKTVRLEPTDKAPSEARTALRSLPVGGKSVPRPPVSDPTGTGARPTPSDGEHMTMMTVPSPCEVATAQPEPFPSATEVARLSGCMSVLA